MAKIFPRELTPIRGTTLAVALAAILSPGLVACGDEGADSADSTATEASPSASADSPDSSDSPAGSDPAGPGTSGSDPTDTGGGAALVGQWTADAADTLAANTANLGMPAGITCSGPIMLDFADDQSFTSGGSVECAAGGLTVTGTMNTTGAWAVIDEATVEISGATSDGSFDVPGIEIPPVDVMSDGSFAYAIEADTLTITFSDPATGEVTQTWTRA